MDEFQGNGTVEHTMMARAALRGDPLNGSIELLPLCNMNCDMCYVRLSREEMEAQGRIRTGAEWLALGEQMAQAGTLFLLLTGGEPLLHPDFKEIYLGLKRLGMVLSVNTNATLIDEGWADFFAHNKPRRINITLYGADEAAYASLCHHPGGFIKVIRAVRLLRQRDVDVRLGLSITPANNADLEKFRKIAVELDVPLNVDTYMMPASRERTHSFDYQSRLLPEAAAVARMWAIRDLTDPQEFIGYRKTVLDQIDNFIPGERKPCSAACLGGRGSFAVNWQGLLRPCVVTTEPAAPAFDLGFAEAWRRVREAFSEVRYCAECSVCALRPLCTVCPAACKMETGEYMQKPEYLCRYAKETLRLLRLTPEEESNE